MKFRIAKLNTLCLAITFFFNSGVLAQTKDSRSLLMPSSGSEGVGGGQRTNVEGQERFRDLVDESACRWISGTKFQTDYAPGFANFLKKLREVHWYFADAIEREIKRIKFCRVKDLKPVPAEDEDSFTIFKKDSVQLAIRTEDKVFVDMDGYQKLALDDDRDFCFGHEIMHSFVPFGQPGRNDRIRSAVLMLYEAVETESLETSILANNLDLPARVSDVDAVREDLATALDSRSTLKNQYAAALRVKSGLGVQKLWARDRAALEFILEAYAGEANLVNAMILGKRFQEVKEHFSERDINLVLGGNRTALHMAAFLGNLEIVEWILSQPAVDVSTLDLRGKTAADEVRASIASRRIVHEHTMKILELLDARAAESRGPLKQCKLILQAHVNKGYPLRELEWMGNREWQFQLSTWQECYRKGISNILAYPADTGIPGVFRYIKWSFDDSTYTTFDSSGMVSHHSPKNTPKKGDVRRHADGALFR
jgi:hypothetical protein